jgi:DMSO/TMAO reductase YedYZ molybdopterin-dependent catalytic subunit
VRRLSLGTGALVGLLLTASLTGILYLGRQAFGLPFVPYEMFNWMSRILPGDLITFGIDLMIDTMLLLGISVVDTAKTAERVMAIIMFLAGGALAGMVFFGVMKARQLRASPFAGLIMGALFGLPQIFISMSITQSPISPVVNILWLAASFLAWGLALSSSYGRLERIGQEADESALELAEPTVEDVPESGAAAASASGTVTAADTRSVEKIDRRQFLVRLGAATATVTVVSGGLGAVLATAERRRLEQELADTMAHNTEGDGRSPFPNANDPVVPVPGTRPEYTPIKDHYKVFLETEPTVIDGASWLLPITGLVDNPLMLTIDDFRDNYEPRDQYVTLTCISGRVGTGLISTTQWTGASVQDVLADAGLQENARYLFITSGDGFYESVDLELIKADERIMFAYAWDGNTLPTDHGYPLRIWIPDRYGMKQPKWITAIEVTDEYREGYWVERNWDAVARVKATSVIDTVAVDHIIENGDQQLVPVGGIAYAGARGISKVEVRVDGGPWQEAQLRAPLSETTWVIWRYEWPFEAGDHTFEVRCAEGDGTPQIEEPSDARPDGSSGIHSQEASL